jgi:hypothetical protein
MRQTIGRILVGVALACGLVSPASAELERVGPVSNAPTIGGYPAWYQDTTGLALEFCDPQNQAEVDGGWCLLLPGDVTIPESFPDNFFDEHFWFAADSSLTPANGGKALLVLGLEAAFGVGPARPGDQIAFARIRLRLDPAPATGRYRFIHPYGEDFVDAAAGERIFFTEDVGITCAPGDFTCALDSRLGPFLVPSLTPGGDELPPVPGPVPGKLYIADPGLATSVTGSALPDFLARPNTGQSTGGTPQNHNVFRIEGPAGSNLGGPGVDAIETNLFTLVGRLYTGTMPGRVTIDRASYTALPTAQKVDVFATGVPTTQGRLPAQPRPPAALPALSFYDAACTPSGFDEQGAPLPPFSAPAAGAVETPMVGSGSHFWGQIQPATTAAIPTNVCVKDAAARDANGNVVPFYTPKPVTDEVSIASALFDPSAGTLSVTASSSDTVFPPTLTLGGIGDLLDGDIVVSTLAPPAKVRVLSSYGGANELQVTTGFGSGAPPAGPVASNDSATFDEDSGAHVIAILANDSAVTGGTVALRTLPRLGAAILNGDGTVTYTPNANASGLDSFSYDVTVGSVTSNSANVALTILPVNDPPVANNNGPFTVLVNAATNLPSLIANDTDPDGAADVVAAANLSTPTPAGAAVTGGANGIVSFLATAAGSYTFTYQARDSAGALSANAALVTVNAVTGDTVTVSSALYRTNADRWIVSGRTTVPNQLITITYADGAAVGSTIGTATADGAGNWLLDIRGVTGFRDPTTLNPRPTRVRATSALGGSGTLGFTIRD